MWVSTFHAACSRILRREASLLGYRSSFTIYDQADAQRLTDWVRRDLNLDPKRFPPRSLHNQISALKNELVLPEEYAKMAVAPRPSAGSPTCTPSTSGGSQEASAVDFDDLLVLAVRLFREHPEALAALPASASSTSSSTSSRTPTPRSSSSSTCSPKTTAA